MVMTSYNNWPVILDSGDARLNRDWEPIPGHQFPGGILEGDVEYVFTYFVRQMDARVEPIEEYAPGDEWGWSPRHSTNSPSLWSCHASATAIDWNATQHGNGQIGTWNAAQIAEIRKIQAECSGVIHWLADTTGTVDSMHFEIRGSSADVKAAANKIRAMTQPDPEPEPEPEVYDDMFCYDYDNGGTLVLIQVACGKQIRLEGATVGSTIRSKDYYIGQVSKTMYDRYAFMFGKAAGMP